MTNKSDALRLRQIAFIDLEASGLGSNSFPTEIGWVVVREDGTIDSGSCLIRPPANWAVYANAWSAAAERLTGITREMLDREGTLPREALARSLQAVDGCELFSDEPDFDAFWLEMVADAAGVSPGATKLKHVNSLIDETGITLEFTEPPRHRAEADARRLASAVLQKMRPRYGVPP